jgi:hypothetical protein
MSAETFDIVSGAERGQPSEPKSPNIRLMEVSGTIAVFRHSFYLEKIMYGAILNGRFWRRWG